MPELDEFPVKIKPHNRARRMKLRYDAKLDCAVITVPTNSNQKESMQFARRHLDWLRAQKAAAPSRIFLMPGYRIPISGTERSICHVPDEAPGVEVNDREIMVGGPLEGLPVRLENYLKKSARAQIEPIAQQMADKTGKKIRKIQIRDTKSRWGSCSSTGTLSFSWRLFMMPPRILEYVVAHEVAHLTELNHSSRFWKIVDRLVPNAGESRKWLRKEGQKLMLVLRQNP